MIDSILQNHFEHELKYQVRKHVAQEIRKRCPEDEPMVGSITVMLGTVIAMAAFYAILGRKTPARSR